MKTKRGGVGLELRSSGVSITKETAMKSESAVPAEQTSTTANPQQAKPAEPAEPLPFGKFSNCSPDKPKEEPKQ